MRWLKRLAEGFSVEEATEKMSEYLKSSTVDLVSSEPSDKRTKFQKDVDRDYENVPKAGPAFELLVEDALAKCT